MSTAGPLWESHTEPNHGWRQPTDCRIFNPPLFSYEVFYLEADTCWQSHQTLPPLEAFRFLQCRLIKGHLKTAQLDYNQVHLYLKVQYLASFFSHNQLHFKCVAVGLFLLIFSCISATCYNIFLNSAPSSLGATLSSLLTVNSNNHILCLLVRMKFWNDFFKGHSF